MAFSEVNFVTVQSTITKFDLSTTPYINGGCRNRAT